MAAFIGTAFDSPGLAQPPEVSAQLAQMGIEPAAITHVVITHAHHDHFNGITVNPTAPTPCFPNAIHMLGQADYADSDMVAALATPNSLEARTLGVVMERHLMRLTSGDFEIIPGVQVFAAPGESPGHQIVRVVDGGQVLYVLGDLFHHAAEVSHPEWMVTWANPHQMLASRQRLIDAALREDALLMAAHIPGVGRLERTANGVRWATIE